MKGWPGDGRYSEDVVVHSERFRKTSEGLMRIGNYEWPDEPLADSGVVVRPHWMVPGKVVPYVPDEERTEPAIICDPNHTPIVRVVPGRKPGISTFHENNPDITRRLIRIVEELLERDDVRMHADNLWYWNRLQEIKEEIANAQNGGGKETQAGNAECPSAEEGSVTGAH